MALHINLYHEIQREKLQRQRDPLKLSMIALGVIAVGFFLYFLVRLEAVHKINSNRAALEAQWNTLKPKFEADKARETELNAEIQASESLSTLIEGRFYWAPILQEVLQIVPPNVQVVNLDGHVVPEKTGGCAITVTGISAGQEPRKAAEDLRTAFLSKLTEKHTKVTSVFGSLDESPQLVQLDRAALRTANFSIHIEMEGSSESKLAAAAAQPAPPVRTRKAQ